MDRQSLHFKERSGKKSQLKPVEKKTKIMLQEMSSTELRDGELNTSEVVYEKTKIIGAYKNIHIHKIRCKIHLCHYFFHDRQCEAHPS